MKKPFVIGVCGNSGSGKTTLVKLLKKFLNEENVLMISTDDYHKWPRGAEEWGKYTHLNPEANNIEAASEHLEDLCRGNSIYKLKYCHETGQLIGPFHEIPQKYIIVEGLHTLFTEKLRKNIAFKIFLDVHYDLNAHFKIHRDMRERGHSRETILKSLESREKDAKKFIYPQKKYADLVIRKNPLIPLSDKKEDTAVEYNFIHNQKIDIESLSKFLEKIFKDKISYREKNGQKILKTETILGDDELMEFKKLSREKFHLDVESTIFGLCQLVTAYNLSYYGHRIGKL